MTVQSELATADDLSDVDETVVVAPTVRRDNGVIFWCLVVLVMLMPLPLASVYTWSWALAGCCVALLLAAWAIDVLRDGTHPPFGLQTLWPLAVPFTLAILWGIAQTLTITPEAWHNPLWMVAADALGTPLSSRITINPYESWSVITRLLTYAGIFFLSFQYCRRVTRTRQVLLAIVIGGSLYAVYGLLQKAAGTPMILWMEKTAYRHDLTSTFVNRNSYAAFAGLGLVCAMGLIIKFFKDVTTQAVSNFSEMILRAVDELSARGWLLITAWTVLLTALVLAHSRGGFASTFVAVVVLMGILTVVAYIPMRVALLSGAGLLFGLLVFLSVSAGSLQQRLVATDLGTEQRPIVYQTTLEAIGDAGSLGTGLGTFSEIFRFYKPEEITGIYNQAHNTYLENTLELGIPAALCLFAVFAGFLMVTGSGTYRRRYDNVYPAIGFAVTVQLAVHALIDFSLQIPAVAATYALLMGAACAQSYSTQRPIDRW